MVASLGRTVRMSPERQKIVQYLNEAHASEVALIRVLQSQIAMTPRGAYRDALETHLKETRDHAQRVERRLGELGQGWNPVQTVVGAAETVIGQALALTKTPIDLLRGTGGEEKVLKNAKDAAATEALEIATYTSLERLAKYTGDEKTAKLAASIRADEERMLERVLREIPKLTDAVAAAELDGDPSFDITETGAGEAVKGAARAARKVPGVKQAEGEVRGAVASEGDLPIDRYDALSATEIVKRLPELSQLELAQIDGYERRGRKRSTVLDRIKGLRGDEPWTGYDELNADEVVAKLDAAGDDVLEAVRRYERAHKDRATVLRAAERELTRA
jgi:ferritin-like metal-binding protein YciE